MRKQIRGVICFGDSVIFGTGASSRNAGCCRILRSLINVPTLIKGRNNDTSKDGLLRLKKDVLDIKDYSHVIILFGNNDCRLIGIDKPLVEIEDYKRTLTKIIEDIKQNNKVPIVSTLQPISDEGFLNTLRKMRNFVKDISSPYEWHKSYSDAIKEVGNLTNTAIIDIHSALVNIKEKILSKDGLHPNDFGHKMIAREFKRGLYL